MRSLAFVIVLLSGPTISLGIGEFEKQIEAATTIEAKISLAEDGFNSIEGFIPRELFMSYWTIDALGKIASSYQSIQDSKGIEGLVPEYSSISRICAMEMGDYRYFFEPLKMDLDSLLAAPSDGNEKWNRFIQEMKAIKMDALSFWTLESIHSLIEFWILSGEAEKDSESVDLLEVPWSESDIEHWDFLLTQLRLSPSQIISAMKTKLLVAPTGGYPLRDSAEGEDSYGTIPEVSLSKSEVSIGGPRID